MTAQRRMAWNRAGQKYTGDTMVEMATNQGLDFQYKLEPMFWEKDKGNDDIWHIQEPVSVMTINGERSLHRYVAPDFEFYQPLELAGKIDEILSASKSWKVNWKPEAAMVFHNGLTTCYLVDLGESQVGKTACRDYLAVADTVDGKHTLAASITRTRIWCANMLNTKIRRAKVSLNIRHSRGHKMTFESTIEGILQSQGNLHEAMVMLNQRMVKEQQVIEFLNRLFPIPDENEETYSRSVVKKMGALQLDAANNFYRMVEKENETASAWTLFNAGQEAIEHGGHLGKDETVIRSLMTGKGEVVQWITNAFELAEQL